jgi:hypothetical protein
MGSESRAKWRVYVPLLPHKRLDAVCFLKFMQPLRAAISDACFQKKGFLHGRLINVWISLHENAIWHFVEPSFDF